GSAPRKIFEKFQIGLDTRGAIVYSLDNDFDEDGARAKSTKRAGGWCKPDAVDGLPFTSELEKGTRKQVVSSANAASVQKACWSLKRRTE
ncbi:MAG: hypothetical protein II621_05450, partial [Clostridia bacterium]|nr:hypothetical protein [Clostridia bacterium]